MENLLDIAQQTFFGISVEQYIFAFLLILGGFVLRLIILTSISRGIKLAKRTSHQFDDVILEAIHKPVGQAAILAGVWLAISILPLPEEPVDVDRFVSALLKAFSIMLAIWLSVRLTDGLSVVLLERAKETETPLDDQLIPIGRNTAKVFFFVIGGVIILQDLGYSVSSLLAGLGIGGMALAFASRDTLANLFGSLVIFIDRPFHVGDWIEMGEIEGTVEEVGLRVTRIRTFANSLITLPNSQLTTTPINNWSRMKKRRIKMTIGLTYSTSPEQLNQAVEKIREILRHDKKISQDFFLVNFHEFGPYSLDIFIYCFTITTSWSEYLQARQELLLEIMAEVQNSGLEFAFPTQTVHLANEKLTSEVNQKSGSLNKELPS